jgi:hypothetical protein
MNRFLCTFVVWIPLLYNTNNGPVLALQTIYQDLIGSTTATAFPRKSWTFTVALNAA